MPNRYISDHLTLKDILSMRSGLAGMEIVPVVKAFKDRQDLVERLRFVPPVTGFRDGYVHNEVLFAYIEDVVQALKGENWYDLIRRYLLQPLGMENTVFIGASGPPNTAKLARGTVAYTGQRTELPLEIYSGIQLIAPAASICTTAEDMAKWLNFLIAGGRVGRSDLVRKQALEMTYKALVARDSPGDLETEGLRDSELTYTRDQNALGWIKGYYKGYSVISQDGTLASYQSLLSVVLHKKAAAYTAFTGDKDRRSLVAKILLNTVGLDYLIDGTSDVTPQKICETLNRVLSNREVASKGNRNIQRVASTNEKFDQYAADYRNYAFGDISVRFNESSNGFSLIYGEAEYKLEKTNVNDTFQLMSGGNKYWYTTNSDYGRTKPIFATFKLDPENRIKSVIITGFDKDSDAEFSTQPRLPYDESYYYRSVCAGSSSTISSLWFTSLVALLCYFR
ncbi:unnamed protein product [Lymnaea stagnalis]|uniref:Beta-lactamase-related domain-containing protein n=1 Tax=Lymnaea stagnalis TaxID=6523 RepID=A0AAV2GZI1_LYMST